MYQSLQFQFIVAYFIFVTYSYKLTLARVTFSCSSGNTPPTIRDVLALKVLIACCGHRQTSVLCSLDFVTIWRLHCCCCDCCFIMSLQCWTAVNLVDMQAFTLVTAAYCHLGPCIEGSGGGGGGDVKSSIGGVKGHWYSKCECTNDVSTKIHPPTWKTKNKGKKR